MNTPIAAYSPRPPRTAQRARDIGVDRSISSRPSVSSEAQPPTSVAAAKPARISPNVMNASWRKRPGADSRSTLGNDRLEDRERVGRELLQRRAERRGRRAEHEAHQRRRRCPTRTRAAAAPRRTGANGPPRPSAKPGRRGHGIRLRRAEVAPRERDDPDREQRRRRAARPGRATPSRAADQRLVVDGPAAPGQVRERREGRCRVAVAVGEVADARARRRRSPPRRRGRRSAPARTRPTRRQRDDAEPRAEPEGRRPTGSRRRAACRTSRRPQRARAS